MAIVPPGSCTPISPNTNYLVTLYGANGQPSSQTIVDGSKVVKTVQLMQQAYCQQQQIQPQIFVQQPNNSTSPLPGLLGLVIGAFAAISLLRSPHMQIGIHNIGDFAKETLGDLVKQTRAGLKKLETKLAPTTNAKVGQQVLPTV